MQGHELIHVKVGQAPSGRWYYSASSAILDGVWVHELRWSTVTVTADELRWLLSRPETTLTEFMNDHPTF